MINKNAVNLNYLILEKSKIKYKSMSSDLINKIDNDINFYKVLNKKELIKFKRKDKKPLIIKNKDYEDVKNFNISLKFNLLKNKYLLTKSNIKKKEKNNSISSNLNQIENKSHLFEKMKMLNIKKSERNFSKINQKDFSLKNKINEKDKFIFENNIDCDIKEKDNMCNKIILKQKLSNLFCIK